MYNTGLIHSGISWWGVYTVVLGTNVPSSCRKYLVYEHFHEHCHLKDVVCARPLWWHCPGATQKLLQWVSSLWWEMKAVSCSKCCKGHFWTEHTSNLHVAFLGWKPCGKALCVLLLPVSSAYCVDIPLCRGLGVLIDQFCNLCAYPLPAVCQGPIWHSQRVSCSKVGSYVQGPRGKLCLFCQFGSVL